ncbi:hypothetical protein [uncultured Methanospirillum sp.]|nr:hypothetical protein [uncultured Methanospirillum sp.]
MSPDESNGKYDDKVKKADSGYRELNESRNQAIINKDKKTEDK